MRRVMALMVGLCCAVGSQAMADELIRLTTRPGVEQRFLLIEPASTPVASVILFAGGKGALGLESTGGRIAMAWGKNNFLVRSRERFAAQGLIVAVVDAPSDRQSQQGMLNGFRNSAAHVADIDQVITYLRNKADVPVWLVGTSRGTESAAYIATQTQQVLGGLVMTSSMTVANAKGTVVTDMPLERIRVPTLVIAHNADQCDYTPPEGARDLVAELDQAPVAELKLFDGGDPPRSKPCRAMSAHGFLGIEDEVVAAIASFIKAH